MSCVTCQVSHVTCQVSHNMCHMSCVTCHVSCVTCFVSPVTCHLPQQQTLPLLTPPLCTVGCLAKTPKPKNFSVKIHKNKHFQYCAIFARVPQNHLKWTCGQIGLPATLSDTHTFPYLCSEGWRQKREIDSFHCLNDHQTSISISAVISMTPWNLNIRFWVISWPSPGLLSQVMNRPGVAGAVLQTPPSLIKWLSDGTFPPNLQYIITPKQWQLDSWKFERMFTPHHVSHVRCQVSYVRCQVSGVRWKV